MKDETIKKIEFLADFVVSGEDETKIKRMVTKLLKARKPSAFRGFIFDLVKNNHTEGGSTPLVKLDEYINYLFPSDSNPFDVRSLLLIAIYERLHEKKIFFGKEEIENQEINN